MADIEIKHMSLFILTKGPSLVKISFFGVGGAAPPKNLFFYPGGLETSNSVCVISKKSETKLH